MIRNLFTSIIPQFLTNYILIIYSKEEGVKSQYKALYPFNGLKDAEEFLDDLKKEDNFNEVVDDYEIWNVKSQRSALTGNKDINKGDVNAN